MENNNNLSSYFLFIDSAASSPVITAVPPYSPFCSLRTINSRLESSEASDCDFVLLDALWLTSGFPDWSNSLPPLISTLL